MTKDEAMKLALEALEALYINDYSGYEISKHEAHVVNDAITALHQVLEQPKKGGVVTTNDTPAFPQERTLPCGSHEECEGLSMRDYFAAKAMQTFCNDKVFDDGEKIARAAYYVADAMLKERMK